MANHKYFWYKLKEWIDLELEFKFYPSECLYYRSSDGDGDAEVFFATTQENDANIVMMNNHKKKCIMEKDKLSVLYGPLQPGELLKDQK